MMAMVARVAVLLPLLVLLALGTQHQGWAPATAPRELAGLEGGDPPPPGQIRPCCHRQLNNERQVNIKFHKKEKRRRVHTTRVNCGRGYQVKPLVSEDFCSGSLP
jgi:hypothetical protein